MIFEITTKKIQDKNPKIDGKAKKPSISKYEWR
jgi:hypothetical protein